MKLIIFIPSLTNNTIASAIRGFALLIVTAIGLSCAGPAAPQGGPLDVVPPELLAVYPAPATIHFTGTKIQLVFSEYVEHRRTEEAVFFSPSVGRKKFDWDGKEVTIEFGDSLKPNTTYIMSLGTDVIDLHNNRMAKTFFLPFSTGDKIDSASFAGRVYSSSPAGVTIFAYKLDNISADTLDPTHTKPDFLTQTSLDGSFLLPYLSHGTYRLIAVRDEYKNFMYDRQVDEYGVLPRDLTLETDSARITGLQFELAKEDTTPPFVTSVQTLDSARVLVRFSEVIDPGSLQSQYLKLTDTLSQQELKINDIAIVGDSAIAAELAVDSLHQDRGYRLLLANVVDMHGNAILVAPKGTTFGANLESDTLLPAITMVRPLPSGTMFPWDTIAIRANRGIERSPFESGFIVLDSGKQVVKGKFTWQGSAWVKFIPVAPLQFGCPYTISLKYDSVRSSSRGRHLHDSTFTITFTTYAKSVLGSIAGSVVRDSGASEGTVYMQVLPVAAPGATMRQVAAFSSGDFSFPNLIEGTYKLFAFRDANGNGTLSYGNVFPFKPSEHFASPTDTLKVRARWPLEGTIVRIK